MSLLTRLKNHISTALRQAEDGDELVTIATFPPIMRPNADRLRSALEANEIACAVSGGLNPRGSMIRVQIRRANLDRARALMKELEES